MRLDQGRTDEALAALSKAFFSQSASGDQRAAAEYQRGVVLADHKNDGREALICFKRSKTLGGSAPDIDRRIAALTKSFGDVDVPELNEPPKNGSGAVGSGNGLHKPTGASPGRPKNIDYV